MFAQIKCQVRLHPIYRTFLLSARFPLILRNLRKNQESKFTNRKFYSEISEIAKIAHELRASANPKANNKHTTPNHGPQLWTHLRDPHHLLHHPLPSEGVRGPPEEGICTVSHQITTKIFCVGRGFVVPSWSALPFAPFFSHPLPHSSLSFVFAFRLLSTHSHTSPLPSILAFLEIPPISSPSTPFLMLFFSQGPAFPAEELALPHPRYRPPLGVQVRQGWVSQDREVPLEVKSM